MRFERIKDERHEDLLYKIQVSDGTTEAWTFIKHPPNWSSADLTQPSWFKCCSGREVNAQHVVSREVVARAPKQLYRFKFKQPLWSTKFAFWVSAYRHQLETGYEKLFLTKDQALAALSCLTYFEREREESRLHENLILVNDKWVDATEYVRSL